MSAIGAIFRFDDRPLDGDHLRRMLDAMRDWGPDPGSWLGAPDAPVALGCRLAPVTPEDAFDRQPLTSADGQVRLVADARIDNRAELAAGLGIRADRARTLPDSAFILAAWEAWGRDCCRHLLGDFAFLLWDARQRLLFGARDHVGRRVLFFHRSHRLLAVASTPHAVVALPEIPARLDEDRVADFLVLLDDADRTFFEGVRRVPAGHTLLADAGGLRFERFWQPDPERRLVLGSDRAYVEGFLEVFGRAVEARLRAAGRIGVSMSGGMDSTAVAAVAARQLRERGQRLAVWHSAPRQGFSAKIKQGWTNDETWAVRAVAGLHDNMDLEIQRPDGATPVDRLDAMFRAIGAPVRNPISIPWVTRIYESAQRAGAGVLLTGQRGNVTVSYSGYRSLRDLAREGHWLTVWRELRALSERRGQRLRDNLRDHVVLPLLPEPLGRLWWRRQGPRAKFIWDDAASAIRTAFAQERRVQDRAQATAYDEWSRTRAGGLELRARMSVPGDAMDVTHGLRSYLGVETRDPTGDPRVVDYCLAIPGTQYLRSGIDRYLIRRAMAGFLPPEVLEKRERGRQASDWFEQMQPNQALYRAEVERIEQSETARRCLDTARLRALVDNWPQPFGPDHLHDYSMVFLRGISMGRFIVWFEETYG